MIEALYGLVLLLVVTTAYGAWSAAPWVPTKPRERRYLLDNLPLTGTERVYDLGCGNGSLLFAVVDRYPNVIAVGYEVSLLLLLVGWAKKALSPRRYRRVQLQWRNLFTADIHDADLVFVFLMPKAYAKLTAKFRRELPATARVAVEAWPLPGITAKTILSYEGMMTVYIYEGAEFGDGKLSS